MDKSSRAYEVAYIHALELVEADAVRPTSIDGQYTIHTGMPRTPYLTQSRRATSGVIPCTCRNTRLRRELGACQHILAAEIYESAEEHARALSQRHEMDWEQLEERLVRDLCHEHDKLTRLRLGVLLATVRRLKDEEAKAILD